MDEELGLTEDDFMISPVKYECEFYYFSSLGCI